MKTKKKLLLKIILIGSSGVGKTSLLHRFVQKKFSMQYKATIGADFYTRDLEVNSKPVAVQIWDTAGQERYQSIGSNFYKGSECCFLVYDITNPTSFESLSNWRVEFLRISGTRNPETFPFIVLGNKCDKENARAVAIEQGRKWAESNAVAFYETSAKEMIGAEEAFMKAVALVLEQREAMSTLNDLKKEQKGVKLTKQKAEERGECSC
eukprot:TRINITY_DN3645_c0_g3_i1.p1 TRINITY_DN3645_c0_g3~~TRINITY_DN3645_c0_g3_i1.p1  ORF type:complete len:209 (+),score=41.05 TRINITY_DN3645_c0_g3_i1:110-736(+)